MFPEKLADREAYILQAVLDGEYLATLAPISSTVNGHEATFYVFSDALKVDNVRVNVSATLAQQIADLLDCSLLTAKLADIAWLQAPIRLPPLPRPITASTAAMLEHSAKIDALLSRNALYQADTSALVQTVGKHWLLDAILGQKSCACNYGWHFDGSDFQGIKGEAVASLEKNPKTKQYYRLIQGRGTAHDRHHADYSQTCVLVSQVCIVDGSPMYLDEVLANPDLAPLASHQGPLTLFRQPGVEPLPAKSSKKVKLPE